MIESLSLRATDGMALEAEVAVPDGAITSGFVLCAETAGRAGSRVEVLPGASHFFTGGTARPVELAAGPVQA